jgi:hypothetical protein
MARRSRAPPGSLERPEHGGRNGVPATTFSVRPVCRWATSGPIAPTAYTRQHLGDIPSCGPSSRGGPSLRHERHHQHERLKDNVYPVKEMTMNTRSIPRRMLLAVAVLAALLLVSPAALARSNNPRVFPPNSHPFGKSYDAWAAAYLAWSDENPNAATDCAQGQQGKVWFLPSFSTDSDDLSVTVLCTVPTGTGFVVPLFLLGSDAVGTCEQEVRDFLEPFGGIGAFEVTIDGRRIRNLSRYSFAGEVAGQETCGYILALPPLPPGEHLVRLVVEAAEVDLQWEITVEPGGQA